ncbi:hypothetical protein Zmor_009135 [Zophobas morio]|uniref:Uncharacterized protein n=1 Tax=Zophobas morio TaxID=2755281 RepID=A0AA38MIG5_9CUCU|nr:hypothetical protein Zmor_009135 [Zophobas morio]
MTEERTATSWADAAQTEYLWRYLDCDVGTTKSERIRRSRGVFAATPARSYSGVSRTSSRGSGIAMPSLANGDKYSAASRNGNRPHLTTEVHTYRQQQVRGADESFRRCSGHLPER